MCAPPHKTSPCLSYSSLKSLALQVLAKERKERKKKEKEEEGKKEYE